MPKSLSELESEALQLDARARQTLAKRLIQSLDGLTDAEYEELWAEEAEDRCAAFLRGELEAEDGDEVLERARNRTL